MITKRTRHLPKTLIAWNGKKEIVIELQKPLSALIYNFELHNLLVKKLYERN